MPPPEMYIMSLKAEPTTEGALRAIGLKERPVDQEQGEEAGREKWKDNVEKLYSSKGHSWI